MQSDLTGENRIRGGLYGLLIGDAVGVPNEFKAPEQLPPFDQIDMVPPAGYDRTYRHVPVGTWSDDGAQALCLLASLLECKGLDLNDFAGKLVNWAQDGYMAVDNHVFDIGIQTSAAVRRLQRGCAAPMAGATDESANGNGSLMRVAPLVLWHQGRDEELVTLAHEQSRVTHGHMRSKVCCALYCLWARELLNGEADSDAAWQRAVGKLREIYAGEREALAELETVLAFDRPRGSGYVVDCLHSARLALQEPTYERVVKRAIALGYDTDTTAAVSGALAGIKFGIDAIPARWLHLLRGKEMVEPLLERLIVKRTNRELPGEEGTTTDDRIKKFLNERGELRRDLSDREKIELEQLINAIAWGGITTIPAGTVAETDQETGKEKTNGPT